MLLYIADMEGEVLSCPKCDRELWPAYWTKEGLKIGFESDFEPEEGQEGLLVCGNLNCNHEEPIIFTEDQTDAVVLNWDYTHMHFYDYDYASFPIAWIAERLTEVERVYKRTRRPKLGSAVALYREEIEERKDKIERWLTKATANGYRVTFYVGEEEKEAGGTVLGHHDGVIVVQTADEQVRVVPKDQIWRERIEYPRKKVYEHVEIEDINWDEQVLFPLGDDRFVVIGGHHLRYGERTEFGNLIKVRCWTAEVAAELRLREVVEGYWEGAFEAEEIERFYRRRDYVKIQGHWLEEISRAEDHALVWTRTKDPAVAAALEMEPHWKQDCDEFGAWDCDEVVCWDKNFPLAEIEEERWEEHPLSLDAPDEWD